MAKLLKFSSMRGGAKGQFAFGSVGGRKGNEAAVR